ncbi:putative methyltransferase PMT11 [Canna indica]|uniref:Methyltransferase n=1 Tax=Canna indica TaxID=4628 RepID=A0AAQ3QQC6_9LILI|nr:putative methyltransferase PMT11 [Canna indica]
MAKGAGLLRHAAELFQSHLCVKIFVLALTAVVSFYLGRHWSDASPQLVFFSGGSSSMDAADRGSLPSSSVSLSPNANVTFNASTLTTDAPPPAVAADLPSPPPQKATVGIVDANGTMTLDFEAGEADPDLAEGLDDGIAGSNETDAKGSGDGERKIRIKFDKFRVCPESMREYIPCMDNEEVLTKLNSTEHGERFERHCPPEGKGLDCLVPAPKDYKKPIPWPQSREEVWFSNVPHSRLVEDKGGQNWISRDKDKFKFPGGGTQFIHGANQYLDQISQMVPDIAFGNHTRVALDVGCGVASFGAFLLSRNVTTMSIAPKDVHENQIQFALERGVPAMIAAFATHRLPYPSQAFDLIHCSRCRINWTRDDGILLLEVNRLLRAGGYFVWAAQPVYKHEEIQQEAWKDMEDLTTRICWQLVKKEGYIAIWQKPLNNSCYMSRDSGVQPSVCDSEDQPNKVWYVNLKACITRIPENGYGANVSSWPARLHDPPQRLQEVEMDSYIARSELFKADSEYWNEIVEGHIRVFRWKEKNLRNVMDMKAGFGGFAAALIKQQIDCWVMNVVPISGPDTLPVIYDRGLIGVTHDWCEPFDTYPRTYDLLHASGLFSQEQKRCNISSILLGMDRILRPGGHVYILDSRNVMEDIIDIAHAMGWRTDLRDTADGPYASRKLLLCDKSIS